MGEILILRGLQRSGKTTYAKKWFECNPSKRVRISRSDLRNMLGNYVVPQRESFIKQVEDFAFKEAMNYGYDIVLDDMNMGQNMEEHLRYLAMMAGREKDVKVVSFLDISLKEIIRRNKEINSKLPENKQLSEEVIIWAFNHFKEKYNLKEE